ncbi:MAG: alpha/beta hydrolase [Verrucomicrobia bacterium]|nr:alpha/beta hydrolase [Verrucomicrobiota bacterium]
MESESLQIRVHGAASLPTLIYLPGLHGDWQLVTRFRLALAGRVRFVEFTYPNTVTWSLEDFAAAVETKLCEHGIERGWLLAESFGSQVAWPLIARRCRCEEAESQSAVHNSVSEKCTSPARRLAAFHADGLILAGGFVRHPWLGGVCMTEWLCRRAPLPWLTAVVTGYAVIARWRFKQSPEVLSALRDFKARWGEPLRHAAVHRLRLIAANDPRDIARSATLPVFQLTGAMDPVVPWLPVQRRLRRECPGWLADRVVWTADHNVLGTGTREAAAQVLAWMGASRKSEVGSQKPDIPR